MSQTVAGDAELAGALATELRGEVVHRDHPEYEAARRVYNASIDKRPGLIARCVDAADVAAALRFARREGLELAVRGGGHSAPGFGTIDDGLVLDLTPIRNVHVDADARLAYAGGGATAGDVDHATHAFGLATPFGVVSTTGVGGLTLGGGTGHLTRKHGLTVDNLVAADVVLADGSSVRASEDEHDDLFWALRGGGGNFGIVTRFTYRLHPVGNVIAGPMFWPIERTPEIMGFYREFILDAPEELNGFFAFLIVPPAPLFPEELHLQKMCALVWCWVGNPEDVDDALRPVRELAPVLDGVHEVPFPALQSVFDPLYPAGWQSYWRADFFAEISDEAVERHLEHGSRMPTTFCGMHLYPVDGAAARPGNDETAWSYRDASWNGVFLGVDPDPARFDEIRQWTTAYWEALHAYSMGGGYVNFMSEETPDRVRASYGGNYDRLAEIKRKYDPDNLFRRNQNIPPA